jgi:hypothetical protein
MTDLFGQLDGPDWDADSQIEQIMNVMENHHINDVVKDL